MICQSPYKVPQQNPPQKFPQRRDPQPRISYACSIWLGRRCRQRSRRFANARWIRKDSNDMEEWLLYKYLVDLFSFRLWSAIQVGLESDGMRLCRSRTAARRSSWDERCDNHTIEVSVCAHNKKSVNFDARPGRYEYSNRLREYVSAILIYVFGYFSALTKFTQLHLLDIYSRNMSA